MNIEICMAVYQRPHRIPEIIEQLKRQTVQCFNLNIWNNCGKELDTSGWDKDKLMVYNSPDNIGSQARFRLVPMVKGETIIFIDDDEELYDDFVEYYLKEHTLFGTNMVLGWFSKLFISHNYRQAVCLLERAMPADYIGTGGMIINRKIFDEEKILQELPPQFCKAEDLYLSYLARKRGMGLFSIEPRCKIQVDSLDQYKNLKTYKQRAFEELREMGWILLKDKKSEVDKITQELYYKITQQVCS